MKVRVRMKVWTREHLKIAWQRKIDLQNIGDVRGQKKCLNGSSRKVSIVKITYFG